VHRTNLSEKSTIKLPTPSKSGNDVGKGSLSPKHWEQVKGGRQGVYSWSYPQLYGEARTKVKEQLRHQLLHIAPAPPLHIALSPYQSTAYIHLW
jgi:hypothetical protein